MAKRQQLSRSYDQIYTIDGYHIVQFLDGEMEFAVMLGRKEVLYFAKSYNDARNWFWKNITAM